MIGLFNNIPHSEGLKAVRETMDKDKSVGEEETVSTEFMIRILELILENNIFDFN